MLIHFTTGVHLYEIQETLGESDLSTVYLAHRTDKNFKIKQTLVIKVFKKEKSLLPILQIESLLRARHSSHLVKVLSFEKIQFRPALILEYISGINLKQLLLKSDLNQNEIACICAQVQTGLEELKKNGLAHGDLSLSNILIDNTGHIYLTDYGLANYNENTLYSTAPFTAPELYKEKSVCFESDLFSLGVVEKVLKGKVTQTELNSLESENFILDQDPLLDSQAYNRKKKLFKFSPKALSSLSYKVHQILFIKKCFPHKQKSILPIIPSTTSPKRNYSHYRFLCLGITFLLFLFTANPFTSYGNYIPSQIPAKILVRTQKWVHIKVAHVSGYTPLNIQLLPGTYKLKWKSYNNHGLKYLYVKAGEEIILRDSDFY